MKKREEEAAELKRQRDEELKKALAEAATKAE